MLLQPQPHKKMRLSNGLTDTESKPTKRHEWSVYRWFIGAKARWTIGILWVSLVVGTSYLVGGNGQRLAGIAGISATGIMLICDRLVRRRRR
jgi:hypothetical protein